MAPRSPSVPPSAFSTKTVLAGHPDARTKVAACAAERFNQLAVMSPTPDIFMGLAFHEQGILPLGTVLRVLKEGAKPEAGALEAEAFQHDLLAKEPAFTLWMKQQTLSLLRAIDKDPVIRTAEANWHQLDAGQRLTIAEQLHAHQARAFGFNPVPFETFTKAPVLQYANPNDADKTSVFNGGFYSDGKITLNLYADDAKRGPRSLEFLHRLAEFTAHEGTHAFQDQFAERWDAIRKGQPLPDVMGLNARLTGNTPFARVAELMQHNMTESGYIPQAPEFFNAYKSNPVERQAREIQNAVIDYFIQPEPAKRKAQFAQLEREITLLDRGLKQEARSLGAALSRPGDSACP